MNKKQVVILGGGFGGVACAQEFARSFPNFQVTLIDHNQDHTIHGNLYELAAAPQELADLLTLKHTVTVPFSRIFRGTPIAFMHGRIQRIIPAKQEVHLEQGIIPYDYLVSALGASANFYGIPGAAEYAIPLQTPGDALRIRDRVEFAVQAHRHDVQKDVIRVLIAGGGIAGCEVAAELQGMLDFVAWKNGYPREKLQTMLIEGTGQLLPGFAGRVVRDVTQRLRDLNVSILTHRMITSVDASLVTFSNGERMEYDCLLWTAGVQANPLPLTRAPLTGKGNRVEVDACFRVAGVESIFTIGDQGCHHDPSGNPLPGTASQAIDQARYIAHAIAALARNQQPPQHACKQYPFIIPLGGKWAIFTGYGWYVRGYAGYLIRRFVWLRYYIRLLGFFSGIQFFRNNEIEFSKNDI